MLTMDYTQYLHVMAKLCDYILKKIHHVNLDICHGCHVACGNGCEWKVFIRLSPMPGTGMLADISIPPCIPHPHL